MRQGRGETGRFLPYTMDQKYDLYVEEYNKAEKSMAKRGKSMYLEKMNKAQFTARIIAEENSGRKAGAKFVRDFVDASKYETTRDRAKAVKIAFKELTGEDFTIASIRMQTKKVVAALEQLKGEYKTLRESGLGAAEASDIISWYYFGSE